MWLLDNDTYRAMAAATKAGAMPTAQQEADFSARAQSDAGSAGRVLTVAGDQAEISIRGVLTKAPSLFAALFGGGNTTYGEIVEALSEADRDPNVSQITLAIDSPGGQFDGLFDALAAIEAVEKPVTAKVGTAASAAFALATQADQIEAVSRASRVGSVGVVASFFVDDQEIDITSTNAPKKRPDVTTEEGVAMVREELDAMHDLFVESIARGRNTTADKVNANFGQGATLLADEALKRGMIDAIAGPKLRVVKSPSTQKTAASGKTLEAGKMDLNTLKSQHPEAYAAAVQDGINQERDRVVAHATMGEASGAMEAAIGAIKNGDVMTATLQATYMAAGMNRSDIQARGQDDADASGADNATASEGMGDPGEAVAGLVEQRLGLGA